MDKKRSHFFKIILPSVIKDGRLGLPKKFIGKFGKDLSDVAVLNVPNGKLWHVELRKAEDQIWFWNGLQEFMDYHSISVGHFLVFRYDGNSCFHVVIFDMSATEIEYPLASDELEEPKCENVWGESVNEEFQKETSLEILPVSPPCQTQGAATKDFDESKDQKSAEINCNIPLSRRRYSLRSMEAKRSMENSDNDLGFYKQRKRSSAQLECPSPKPRRPAGTKKKQLEYAGKMGILPDDNELIQVKQKKSKEFNYVFEKKIEVISVDSDSSGNDEPITSTTCKSFSCRTDNVNWHPTKNMENSLALAPYGQHISVQFEGSELQNSLTDEVDSHHSKTESGNNFFSIFGVIQEIEPVSVTLRPEKEKGIVAARGFRSENPFCTITMHPSYLSKHTVNLPLGFARRYLEDNEGSVTLRVLDGRAWDVQHWLTQHCCKLTRGWKKFASENHLKKGDVCIFELIKNNSIELKVSIFRVVKNVQLASGEAKMIE